MIIMIVSFQLPNKALKLLNPICVLLCELVVQIIIEHTRHRSCKTPQKPTMHNDILNNNTCFGKSG